MRERLNSDAVEGHDRTAKPVYSQVLGQEKQVKIMNKVDISQDQVFAILEHLPKKRNGKIKVEEFLNLPIISEDAFKAIDRNRDGFLSRGELKLTNKNATMGEVNEVR